MSHNPNDELLPGEASPADQKNERGGTPAPEETAEYWRSKYTGLHGYVHGSKDKPEAGLKVKFDQLAAELKRTQEQFAGAEVEWTSKYNSITQEATQHKTAAEQALAEAASLKAKQAVGKEIRSKYPTLASLYDEGYLLGVESMDEAARAEYLNAYSQRLGLLHEANVKDGVKGSVPPPPSADRKEGVPDRRAALKHLESVSAKHGINSPEYAQAMEEYMNTVE